MKPDAFVNLSVAAGDVIVAEKCGEQGLESMKACRFQSSTYDDALVKAVDVVGDGQGRDRIGVDLVVEVVGLTCGMEVDDVSMTGESDHSW